MKSFNLKVCRTCKGNGELRSSHPDTISLQGEKVVVNYEKYPDSGAPTERGGMSGEVVADASMSICGVCSGAGIVLEIKR